MTLSPSGAAAASPTPQSPRPSKAVTHNLSAQSPPRMVREHAPSSSPTCSEAESTDDLSSDDEDGVFIGDHQDVEAALALKLSLLSPSGPAPTPGSSRRHSTRSAPSTLKKRDSREFHRRKTILWPLKGNVGKDDERKVWEGGFYERKDGNQDPAACDSTTSQRTVYFSSRTDTVPREEDGSSSSSRQTVFFSASSSTPTRLPEKRLLDLSTLISISDENQYCHDLGGVDEDLHSHGSSEVEGDSDKENVGLSSSQDDVDGNEEDEEPSQPFVSGMEAGDTDTETEQRESSCPILQTSVERPQIRCSIWTWEDSIFQTLTTLKPTMSAAANTSVSTARKAMPTVPRWKNRRKIEVKRRRLRIASLSPTAEQIMSRTR